MANSMAMSTFSVSNWKHPLGKFGPKKMKIVSLGRNLAHSLIQTWRVDGEKVKIRLEKPAVNDFKAHEWKKWKT